MPSSPYSIHAIATGGVKYNKQIGDWHGPNTVSYVIRFVEIHSSSFLFFSSNHFDLYYCNFLDDLWFEIENTNSSLSFPLYLSHQSDLVESHAPDHNSIGIYISSDGVIYKDGLFNQPHTSQIILVPLRLGVHVFNKSYTPSIQMLFSIPQFLGIIGGRPSSSYFFIGHHEENLFYLDPHTNQSYVDFTPAVPEELVKESVRSSMLALLSTYQPTDVGRMPIAQIDPSLTLGFYCHDAQDFANLEEAVKTLLPHSRQLPALFTFDDITPNYEAQSSSGDIISFAEDDF
jgi:cysteine protease ATG4